MVCGVGREPSQWVKAPAPAQGKIGHMKGAVGQFWLPEILGSSPRLEQDNEIARALHAAMRVGCQKERAAFRLLMMVRLVSLMMLRFAQGAANLTACTTLSFSNRILPTLSMGSLSEFGLEQMRSGLRQFAI